MSISQLDDPSVRTALGIETDQPSQLTSPVVIGSVTLTDGGAGLLNVTDTVFASQQLQSPLVRVGTLNIQDNGGAQLGFANATSIRIGAVPVTGITEINLAGLRCAQVGTGTTTQVVAWDNNLEETTLNNVVALNGQGACALNNIVTVNAENPNTSKTSLVTAAGSFALDGTEQQLAVNAYALTNGKTYGCWGQAYLAWNNPPAATDKVYFIFRTSTQANAFDNDDANTRWTIYPAVPNTAGLIETYVSFAGSFVAEADSTLRISVLGAVGTPADYTADFTNLAIQRLD